MLSALTILCRWLTATMLTFKRCSSLQLKTYQAVKRHNAEEFLNLQLVRIYSDI